MRTNYMDQLIPDQPQVDQRLLARIQRLAMAEGPDGMDSRLLARIHRLAAGTTTTGDSSADRSAREVLMERDFSQVDPVSGHGPLLLARAVVPVFGMAMTLMTVYFMLSE